MTETVCEGAQTARDAGPRAALTTTLRELAWTIHRRVPDRAGVEPVPPGDLAMLKRVLDEPGATVGELAAHLRLQQPNASAVLRRLEQRGLVRRRPDPGDRRVSRIHPSPRAEAEHAAIALAWAGALDDALRSLDPEQRRTLDAALDALRALDGVLRAAESV